MLYINTVKKDSHNNQLTDEMVTLLITERMDGIPGTGSEPYVISSLCDPTSFGFIISSNVPSCLSINEQ